MLTLPPSPETRVEQMLDRLSECSRKFVTPRINSSFKVKQNLTKPYISISGPTENIRLLFNVVKGQFADAEEITENRLPVGKVGFYESGETPFGIVPPAMGRSRLVIRFYDLKEDDLKKIIDMYYRPDQYLAAAMPGHIPPPVQER